METLGNLGLIKPMMAFFKTTHQRMDGTLISRLRKEIETTRQQCKASTNKNKVTAVNALNQFVMEMGLEHISIYSITADHIKAFERWALDGNYKPNYVALHMRCLRSLFNHINGSGNVLFKPVRTTNCQTEKRAVSETVMKRIIEMPLPDGSSLAQARDVFLFCFLCMGMPLIDAALLKKKQFKGGYISYRRQKTGRQVRFKVGNQLQLIIHRLSTSDSPYLLPIITSSNRSEVQRQYQRFYQRYMRALQEIARKIGGDTHLTSYTPRHTWASIAYKCNVGINVIAQALTHANTNITYSYIKELCDGQLDAANAIVIQTIM